MICQFECISVNVCTYVCGRVDVQCSYVSRSPNEYCRTCNGCRSTAKMLSKPMKGLLVSWIHASSLTGRMQELDAAIGLDKFRWPQNLGPDYLKELQSEKGASRHKGSLIGGCELGISLLHAQGSLACQDSQLRSC